MLPPPIKQPPFHVGLSNHISFPVGLLLIRSLVLVCLSPSLTCRQGQSNDFLSSDCPRHWSDGHGLRQSTHPLRQSTHPLRSLSKYQQREGGDSPRVVSSVCMCVLLLMCVCMCITSCAMKAFLTCGQMGLVGRRGCTFRKPSQDHSPSLDLSPA